MVMIPMYVLYMIKVFSRYVQLFLAVKNCYSKIRTA